MPIDFNRSDFRLDALATRWQLNFTATSEKPYSLRHRHDVGDPHLVIGWWPLRRQLGLQPDGTIVDIYYGQSYHAGTAPGPLGGLFPVGTLMDWPVRTTPEQEILNVASSVFSFGKVIEIIEPTEELPFTPPARLTSNVFGWLSAGGAGAGQLYPDGHVLRNPDHWSIGQTWTAGEPGTFTEEALPWKPPPKELLGAHPDGYPVSIYDPRYRTRAAAEHARDRFIYPWKFPLACLRCRFDKPPFGNNRQFRDYLSAPIGSFFEQHDNPSEFHFDWPLNVLNPISEEEDAEVFAVRSRVGDVWVQVVADDTNENDDGDIDKNGFLASSFYRQVELVARTELVVGDVLDFDRRRFNVTSVSALGRTGFYQATCETSFVLRREPNAAELRRFADQE